MRVLILLTTVFFMLQLNACVSQVDTTQNETGGGVIEKKNKSKTERASDHIKVLEDVPQDIKVTTPTNSQNQGVNAEDQEMRLSIITYENVISKAQKANAANEGKEVEEEETLDDEGIRDEAPVQGQKVKLRIQNNHSTAMWYLMPVAGEKAMPSDGKFHPNPEVEIPFLAKKFGSSGQQLVELIYYGKDGQSFRAFYVQAGASLLFRNYDLGTYRQGDYVPFWSAKSLDVNNEAHLEDWLPFSVLSSPNIVLHNTTESGSAKWENISNGATFPKNAIQFIQAEGIKQYQIPVGVVR